MFACRACTRRLLDVVVRSAIPVEATSRAVPRDSLPRASAPATLRQQRAFATAAPDQLEGHVADDKQTNVAMSDDVDPRQRLRNQRALRWQLDQLGDPYQIAKHVEVLLSKSRFAEALDLAREASRTEKVAVSWNYLIEYEARHKGLRAAMKLFNEMKKRNQQPTAQTYTMILKECADLASSPHALSEAVKLYNNMLKSERIKPNTIHLNAMLRVCSKAHDVETMFTILESINQGIRAPNNQTFTTVLNALRAHADREKKMVERAQHPQLETLPDDYIDKLVKQTIERAQAIWQDVKARWESADVVVDEELVCAMGRVLLLGSYHEKNSILELVEQTMGVPRDEGVLIALAREAVVQPDADHSQPQQGNPQASPSREMRKVHARDPKPASPGLARPGKNTLSLILAAIEDTGKTSLAPRYWEVFTRKYIVEPDGDNWRSLLRSLNRGHNSAKTVDYLRAMPPALTSERTFLRAMKTCMRDNLNKHAFHHATQVLEMMLVRCRYPDLATMRLYLQIAYANKRPFDEWAKKDPTGAKLAYGKQLIVALNNLWEPYKLAAKQFAFGGITRIAVPVTNPETEEQQWMVQATEKFQVVALARKMISASDRLTFGDLVPPDMVAHLKGRSVMQMSFVTQFYAERAKYDPVWQQKDKAARDKGREEQEEGEGNDMGFFDGDGRH